MSDEKIIIVDDEADVLELCERILTVKGYQVKTAFDGYEAIEMAEKEHFNLLLTDIKMPGMDGLEIAQALKKSDQGLVCVIMTGYSTMDMVIDALKLGVDEFIMKPFGPDELSLVVTKALEKEELRKENFRLRSLIPLFELNQTLMGTVEVEEVLRRLLEIAQKETNADRARLYTFEADKITHFHTQTDSGENEQYRKACDKLAQFIFEEDQQMTLTQQVSNGHHQALFEELEAQAIITTPLKSQNRNLGALILVREKDDFTPSDSEFLAVLSSQAGIALENARLFTEIQQAYKELQTLDDMKSEFINIAAHELRTPLAILVGYATVLEEELEGVHHLYLTNIMRNALRLRSLIDDMLSLQYLESGMTSLSQDTVNLNEAIQEVIQDMALMAAEKNLELKIHIPDDFPEMTIDRYKFELIIVNLIHNAIKFTPKDGQVTFRAILKGEQTTMSVHNTGSVIPPEEFGRVFDRFYQIESSLTRQHGGIGLGLSIVRGMIEICGGEIQVESEEEKGTTFTFNLPLDNSHLEPRIVKL
jgi:signal transduction histidine kinase